MSKRYKRFEQTRKARHWRGRGSREYTYAQMIYHLRELHDLRQHGYPGQPYSGFNTFQRSDITRNWRQYHAERAEYLTDADTYHLFDLPHNFETLRSATKHGGIESTWAYVRAIREARATVSDNAIAYAGTNLRIYMHDPDPDKPVIQPGEKNGSETRWGIYPSVRYMVRVHRKMPLAGKDGTEKSCLIIDADYKRQPLAEGEARKVTYLRIVSAGVVKEIEGYAVLGKLGALGVGETRRKADRAATRASVRAAEEALSW